MYTGKQERKADHITESYESRGVPEKEAERIAWATVNKESGGGKRKWLRPRAADLALQCELGVRARRCAWHGSRGRFDPCPLGRISVEAIRPRLPSCCAARSQRLVWPGSISRLEPVGRAGSSVKTSSREEEVPPTPGASCNARFHSARQLGRPL
jgi:hypothetical protein